METATLPNAGATTVMPPAGSSPAGEKQPPASTPDGAKQQSTTTPSPAKDLLAAPSEKKADTPSKYELKHADGKTTFAHESFDKAAAKHGLSAEAAQDVFAALAPALQEQVTTKQNEERERLASEWYEQTVNDKDFGGEKANLEKSMSLVNSALDAAPKIVRELLQKSRLGNNLEILKWLKSIGKTVTPDTKVVRGNPGSGAPQTPQEKLAKSFETKR